MKKLIVVLNFVILLAMASSSMAATITITPSSGTINVTRWEGTDPCNPKAGDICGIVGFQGLTELYKATPNIADTGPFADSFDTTFNSDVSGGTIAYIVGEPAITGSPVYLLVKDGCGGPISPYWYVFDLTALGWNGQDDIAFSSFWPSQGGISHVALYGVTGVPDGGATAILLGLAIAGIGTLRGFAKRR